MSMSSRGWWKRAPLAPFENGGWWALALAPDAHDEGDNGHDHEDEEQDLGDRHRARGDAAEAEQGGDQRDHQENDGVVQHVVLLGRKPRFVALRMCARRLRQGYRR